MDTQVVASEAAPEPVGTQLINLDPVQYVAAVYVPFRERLAEAKAAVAGIAEVDVSTPKAMAVAVKHRAVFRAIRIEAEAARKARKAPVLDIGRLLDSRYKELEQEIAADEDRFDAAIKAEETRKAAEKAAAEAAEKARIAAIHENLAKLSGAATAYAGKPSAAIADGIARLKDHDVTTWAAEFLPVAQEAHASALAALTQMHAGAVAQEAAAAAEAKRIADERAELARLRAEDAERRKAEAAKAEEENRKRAAEEAESRARIAAEEKAARERIEAAEAEARAKAEAERQAREAEEAKARAIRDAEEARQRAERERLEAESRKLEEERRQAAEREAAVQREIERARMELMNGAELLRKFVDRFGARREFSGVVKAINTYFAKAQPAAVAEAA